MKESFEIIPAIDILDGKCVRLTQGKYDQVEEFSTYPEEIAKKWVNLGAKRLHIIDLDGAKEGTSVNYKVITKIAKSTDAKIQVGGGIRTQEAIKKYINEGVDYVILSTKAILDKSFLQEVSTFYGERIIISLDLKNNRVALSGWLETIDTDISKLLEEINKNNIKRIIYTDITRDGTLSGPNLKPIEELAKAFKSEIVVSGGISSINDILSILNLRKEKYPNINGVILGKSLYKGTINLPDAIEITNKT